MSTINVPISTSTFLSLANFLKEVNSERDPVAAIEDAVDYWIENARWKTADLLPETVRKPPKGEYIWKAKDKVTKVALSPVILPHGTQLRMSTASGMKNATVDDGRILFGNSHCRSPNHFAEKAAGHPRDAWRDVWIKRPTDKNYVLADDLRELKRGEKGA